MDSSRFFNDLLEHLVTLVSIATVCMPAHCEVVMATTGGVGSEVERAETDRKKGNEWREKRQK